MRPASTFSNIQLSNSRAAPTDTCHNMPFELTAKDVYAAILAADAIGKSML